LRLLASKAHRVAKGLVRVARSFSGLPSLDVPRRGTPYVANSGQGTYFKVPYGWHKISDTSLAAELKAVSSGSGARWLAAYEAGGKPTADDYLAFGTSKPFVFAETGTLSSTESIVVFAFVVSRFVHTSPIRALIRAPGLIWHALPFVLQMLAGVIVADADPTGMNGHNGSDPSWRGS
jgi:hypothetical protein